MELCHYRWKLIFVSGPSSRGDELHIALDPVIDPDFFQPNESAQTHGFHFHIDSDCASVLVSPGVGMIADLQALPIRSQ
jgi:hypothetical protein